MREGNLRPQRTCLGCGEKDSQARLIRLTLDDQNRLVLDRSRGRGGYLHWNQQCWRGFIARKSHYRAFRAELSRTAKEQLILQLKSKAGVTGDG